MSHLNSCLFISILLTLYKSCVYCLEVMLSASYANVLGSIPGKGKHFRMIMPSCELISPGFFVKNPLMSHRRVNKASF